MEISSETSAVLDLPPSAVAFCPSHPDYYVVGTYFLHPKEATTTNDSNNNSSEEPSDEAPQKRTGTLILYRLEGSVFSQAQTVPLDSAVLDLEWTPHVSTLGALLSVATSTGSLEFYSFDAETANLKWHGSKQISETSTLVLDLVWHPSRADSIAVTLSDGVVAVCESGVVVGSGLLPWSASSTVTMTELTTHSLEPWTLAFSPDASRVFSGGDDAVLQALELSSSSVSSGRDSGDHLQDDDDDDKENDALSATLLWSDRKIHEAGVTSILPLANDLLVTGSYDDRIRLLSAPVLGRRKVLAELDLGGGVWRLKVLGVSPTRIQRSDQTAITAQTQTHTLLASCMHAGTRIVQLTHHQPPTSTSEEEWDFTVQARFEEHKSMNYGSDARVLFNDGGGDGGGSDGKRVVVVSTSFYDRLMCVWGVGI